MSLSAGLICKRGEDVTPYLLNMLLHVSPITTDNYGLASTKNSQYSRTLDGFSSLNSDIGIAHKLVKINPYDNDQPIQQNSNSSIILGRFWDTFDSDIITYSEIVRNGIDDGMKKILTEYDCTFSIIAAENNQLICCRDHVGNIPLYFGENERFIGAATNMKMLRLLRLKIRSIPPGSIIIIKKAGLNEIPIRKIEEIKPNKEEYEDIKSKVKAILLKAIEKRCKNLYEPAISFSGGLDSSLLAELSKNLRVNPRLFCVGMEGSVDLKVAEEAADALNLPLTLESVSLKELEKSLPNIVESIEESDFLQVGIAGPLYFASKEASNRGYKIIISGNGSDEIFAGYAKYFKAYNESEKKVIENLNYDVLNSYKINFDRDWKICTDNGLELRLPFTDHMLIEYTRRIPIEYLLSKSDDSQRKIVLRDVAKELGLSHKIALRPKKAAQYSSGFSKGIQKLAKRKGLTIQGYLSKMMKFNSII